MGRNWHFQAIPEKKLSCNFKLYIGSPQNLVITHIKVRRLISKNMSDFQPIIEKIN